ncbi:unnamed protein product, partial [Coregonus sp. 'balchen']
MPTLWFISIVLLLSLYSKTQGLPHRCFQVRHQVFKPQFKDKYFPKILDHFNFNSMGNGTYEQQYLITDEYWKRGYGPNFLYTGNEGDIWELALILTLLSIYGGMLSVRYLNIVAGALAASAPILSTAKMGESTQFLQDVTSAKCRDAVRGVFQRLQDLAQIEDYGRIQSEFSLCKTPCSHKDIHQLNGFLRNAFTLMVILDYPYSTHFMGSMPANPVKVLLLTNTNSLEFHPYYVVQTILWRPVIPCWVELICCIPSDTAGIVYNSTGDFTFFDLYTLYVESLSTASNILFSNGDLDPWIKWKGEKVLELITNCNQHLRGGSPFGFE